MTHWKWSVKLRRSLVALALAGLFFEAGIGAQPGPGRPGVRNPGEEKVQAAATEGTPAAPLETPPLEVAVTDQGISVFAVNADMPEFFTQLGLAARVQIIIDDTVKGKITTQLTNKTIAEIMESLSTAYGISASLVDGVYIVSEGIPKNPSSYLVSDIEAIPTQYVRAETARELLPLILQNYVKANREQNSVVLAAPTAVLRKFREDITQFDIPATQIMFDVLMVEFTDEGLEEFESSLTWKNATEGVNVLSATGDLLFRGVARLPTEFVTDLTALIEKRKARVRANPSIAALSGQTAGVFIGLTQYVQTPVQVGQGRYDQRNYIDAGVRLAITPYTGGQGEIIVDLSERWVENEGGGEQVPGIEVSTLTALDPITNLPNKSIRTANTIVRVQDGETVIIGGLRQTELRETKSKIPILGDLPGLGPLFRSKRVEEMQTELVIFITPRILSQTGHLPEEEEAELKRRFLGTESDK